MALAKVWHKGQCQHCRREPQWLMHGCCRACLKGRSEASRVPREPLPDPSTWWQRWQPSGGSHEPREPGQDDSWDGEVADSESGD